MGFFLVFFFILIIVDKNDLCFLFFIFFWESKTYGCWVVKIGGFEYNTALIKLNILFNHSVGPYIS